MVPGDDMGAFERAWLVAGFHTVADEALPMSEVICALGEVPVLCVRAALLLDAGTREGVYGWAMAQLSLDSLGWLGLVRRLRYYHAPRELEEAG